MKNASLAHTRSGCNVESTSEPDRAPLGIHVHAASDEDAEAQHRTVTPNAGVRAFDKLVDDRCDTSAMNRL